MRLIIGSEGVDLVDPDDFGSLSASTGLAPGVLDAAVVDLHLGRLDADGQHVWIEPGVLEAAAGRTGRSSWSAGFTAMCGYAAAHGWTDGDGRIRAHLTAPDAPDAPDGSDGSEAPDAPDDSGAPG